MKIDIVAWYASVLSTAGFCLALYLAWRDRASVRIQVSRDMEGFGSVYEPDQKFVVVNVANRGRRPVTIKTVSFSLPNGKGELLLDDALRGGPIEITEGKSHPFAASQEKLPLGDVRYAVVMDLTGRSWKKRVRLH